MADGARTHDRRNHNPELYQLSYSHHYSLLRCYLNNSHPKLARPAGFEPATLGLEGRCSILMSYGRMVLATLGCQGVQKNGRGGEIRTPDILHPKQARYQTALHPETLLQLYLRILSKINGLYLIAVT